MNHDGAFGCECGHMNAVDPDNEDNHESSSSISICLCRLINIMSLYFYNFPDWVCLKIGYIPNYTHLIGIMIINHWVKRGTLFSDTPYSYHSYLAFVSIISHLFPAPWHSAAHQPEDTAITVGVVTRSVAGG